MKKKFIKGTAVVMIAAMGIHGASFTACADESQDVAGTIGFAKVGEEGASVNVRAEASTDAGEVVGYLENGDCAEIISVEDDGWYRIRSGNVEGYVASWLIATGAEADAIAAQTGYTYARVNAESLNVRTDKSEDAGVIGALAEGDEAEVTEAYDGGAFVRVCLDADTYGYVSADYVELETVYPTGQTVEELNAGEASREAEQTGSDDAQGWTDTQSGSDDGSGSWTDTSWEEASGTGTADAGTSYTETSYTDTSSSGGSDAGTAADTSASSGSSGTAQSTESAASASSATASATGSAIASYACQFVGNPYVWGGSSLTSGADCSGFTMAVFAHFGISLPHYAASQYSCGTPVSISNLAVGDLVFFSSSGGSIDHVGIYVGGGSIVHAANASKGICYGSLSYSTPVAACRVA